MNEENIKSEQAPRSEEKTRSDEKPRVEEFHVTGSETVAKIRELIHEGNVRRITLKNEEGRTLIEFPLTIGVIGAVLLPVLAAVGAIAALAANLTIVVEKVQESETSRAIAVERSERSEGSERTVMGIKDINVAFPATAEKHLKITVGACRLHIKPGDGDAWVTGTYDDPSNNLPLKVTEENGTTKISQEYDPVVMLGLFGSIPQLELTLGKGQPYTLTIETGANEGDLDLGGLPLQRLALKTGASKYVVNFSAPNPQPMSLFDLGSGAGSVDLRNLSNANFADLRVEGGAAAYQFDFGGTLQRDGQINVSTGMSSVTLSVPASTAARITPSAVMGGLDIGDGFMKKEGAFWTEAALAGKTPSLTVRANVALGSIQLYTK